MAFSYQPYKESDAVIKARQEAEAKKTYNESQNVIDARNQMNAHNNNKVANWTGGTYGQALQNAMDRINNREKFSYDLNGDALYQQYKQQYMTQGKLAMQDTMGMASAMTGGYGSSYAETVGNQAYQGYLAQLNDVVPQLYQMAMDRYNQEGADLYNQYNLTKDAYNTEYGEHRDAVADWNAEADRLANQYYNESNLDYSRYADARDYANNVYNNERNYDYGQYSDNYNRAFSSYQQGVAENQFAQNMALQQAELQLQKDKFDYDKQNNSLQNAYDDLTNKYNNDAVDWTKIDDITGKIKSFAEWGKGVIGEYKDDVMKSLSSYNWAKDGAYSLTKAGANAVAKYGDDASAAYGNYVKAELEKYEDKLTEAETKALVKYFAQNGVSF